MPNAGVLTTNDNIFNFKFYMIILAQIEGPQIECTVGIRIPDAQLPEAFTSLVFGSWKVYPVKVESRE